MKRLSRIFPLREREPQAPESPELFERETRQLMVHRLKAGLMLGIILIPLFSFLDFVCLPELAAGFLVTRLLCSLGFIVLLSFLSRPRGEDHPFGVALMAYILAASILSFMVVQHGGYGSYYYAGLLMLMVTFCVLLPLNVSQTAAAGGLILAIYVLPIAAFCEPTPDSLAIFTSNLFFFISFFLVMLILSKVETDNRVREFNLKTRLESSRKELAYHAEHLEEEVDRRARELQESELRYKELYEDIIDMLVLIDDQGRVLKANHIFCQVMDFDHGQGPVLLQDFVVEEDRPGFRDEVLLPLLENRDVRSAQFRMVASQGLACYVECNATRITRDAEVIGSQLVIRDVTERKQAEEERDVLQSQLLQAQKMESVGRLAGGVAHDLNNMLVAILGYGEMLEADPDLGDKHKRRVKLMYQAGMRSRNLVSQLLAFSRKQTMQMELLDINQVLSDFRELLEKAIREDIEVQLRLSEDLPAVQADKSQLEQVILNLAVNAQDAMPAGGRLTIETSPAELDKHYASHHMGVVPGRYLMLVVSDTGLGMDKETRDHIFEPFFTTKNIGQGTGLGLATVYGVVKQHQGTIWVYSEPGQGTTFKVYLPASDTLQAGERKADQEVLTETRGSETVLVIEDDDMVRDLAVSVLEDQGYNVLSAANAMQCLELLKSHQGPFDLMLTDVIMPDLNGKDLYDKVAWTHPEIRVLYMSGYTGNVISHHGVLEKGVAFLQKPFSAQSLCLKVREVLDRDE